MRRIVIMIVAPYPGWFESAGQIGASSLMVGLRERLSWAKQRRITIDFYVATAMQASAGLMGLVCGWDQFAAPLLMVATLASLLISIVGLMIRTISRRRSARGILVFVLLGEILLVLIDPFVISSEDGRDVMVGLLLLVPFLMAIRPLVRQRSYADALQVTLFISAGVAMMIQNGERAGHGENPFGFTTHPRTR